MSALFTATTDRLVKLTATSKAQPVKIIYAFLTEQGHIQKARPLHGNRLMFSFLDAYLLIDRGIVVKSIVSACLTFVMPVLTKAFIAEHF